MSIVKDFKKFFFKLNQFIGKDEFLLLRTFVGALISAFCLVSSLTVSKSPVPFTNVDMQNQINKPLVTLIIGLITLLLTVLAYYLKSKYLIPGFVYSSATLFCISLSIKYQNNLWFFIGLTIILVIIVRWSLNYYDKFEQFNLGTQKQIFSLSNKTSLAFCIILFLTFTFFVSKYTIIRHLGYNSSTYDFGIFAQMFEYMRTTGLPLTTVERNKLLSHFAVHFSPFFYLLLPFYLIYPSANCLLILQAAAVALGVIPVYLICKHFKFNPIETKLISLIYIFYPTMLKGCFYDFHENKFLSVLILFALYYILKKNTIPALIFSILICSVKEDAAIYVMALALFIIFYQKERMKGSLLLVFAVGYFFFATKMVEVFGGEIMIDRLGNYFPTNTPLEDKKFTSIIIGLFYNFGYLIKEMFTQLKVQFLAWLFLPVLFTPFFTKKLSVFFLLLPIIVINLMSNWPYQFDIGFQYTYGSAALIIGATIITLKKIKPEHRRLILLTSAAIAMSITISTGLSTFKQYSTSYEIDKQKLEQTTRFVHDTVPKDANIIASGFLMPQIADYKNIYNFPYEGDIDYCVVLQSNYSADSNLQTFLAKNFKLIANNGHCWIYEKIK